LFSDLPICFIKQKNKSDKFFRGVARNFSARTPLRPIAIGIASHFVISNLDRIL
jgi:predicted RNA-binding protein with PUA-like domain